MAVGVVGRVYFKVRVIELARPTNHKLHGSARLQQYTAPQAVVENASNTRTLLAFHSLALHNRGHS
ncbi:MAG: hypothetical protein DDT38_01443 [Firmicutes bacterium]|nr:hypothetical protein [candidate division NPL-UPA2 bacterium]